MEFEIVVFYVTLCLVTISAVGVVGSNNPVYSILFLVLLFLESSVLLVFLGLEFVALVLVVVYVGAVAVLFLFVCMMLNVRQEYTPEGVAELIPVGFFFVFLLSAFFVPALYLPAGAHVDPRFAYVDWLQALNGVQSIHALAKVLYSAKVIEFTMAAIILLSAMVIGISVTLWKRVDLRSRNFQIIEGSPVVTGSTYFRAYNKK
jgi:NADH-quinone oxidoreductase subunit J